MYICVYIFKQVLLKMMEHCFCKQNSGSGSAVSLQPSLLVQADMGMGEPHSQLAMYASAERQTCDHDWY